MSRFLSTMFVLFVVGAVHAQSLESLKSADKTLYDNLVKKGEGDPTSKEAREVFAKQARYLVGRLSDPTYIENQSNNITEAFNALPVQKDKPKTDLKPEQLILAHELGNAMLTELKATIKKYDSSKTDQKSVIIRLNAVRMLSVVALIGCDDVAAVALEILEDPKESEGVKLYALQTLKHIFAFVSEPGAPEKSVFRKETREVEHKSIQFLCDYVLKPKTIAPGTPQEQIDVVHYLRREAVQALGFVRNHRLRFQGQVLAKPGWVLLKVANKDGIEPPPEPLERTQAIYAFTQLFPVTKVNTDRNISIEYAADRLGAPMLDLVTLRVNPPLGAATQVASVPWVVTAHFWDIGLNLWQKNLIDAGLDKETGPAKTLYTRALNDLLTPLKSIGAGAAPDTGGFQTWFSGVRSKATSLYDDDPTATVKPCIESTQP